MAESDVKDQNIQYEMHELQTAVNEIQIKQTMVTPKRHAPRNKTPMAIADTHIQ